VIVLRALALTVACVAPLACALSLVPGRQRARDLPFRHMVIDRDYPRRPHCKTTADVDGDGFVDVLAGSAQGGGLWWYAWPDWTKHRIAEGSFSTDMQAGDVDGDGDLDAIVPQTGVGLVWFENPRPAAAPTQGTWRRHGISREVAHDVEVGDVDGDGRLDVVARSDRTRVYLQKAPDQWTEVIAGSGGRGGTALGDLDGDGDLDIAQNGYWLENPGSDDADWPRHEIATGWPDDVGVHIADVNGDGRPDVLMAHAEMTGKLVWYEAKEVRRGPWTEHFIAEVSHVHTFKTADMDRDGTLDVVTAEMEQSPQKRVMIHFNGGRGLHWRTQVVGRSGSHNLRLADIGGDGDTDIVGANHGNYGGPTPIEYWENLSHRPTPPLPLDRWERHVLDADRPGRAIFLGFADLDGDDRGDVVTGAWWYRNPGTRTGTWERRAMGEPLHNVAAVFDFDLDGDMDLLGTTEKGAEADGELVWARNDGKGAFTLLSNIPPVPDGDVLQGVAVGAYSYSTIDVALSWRRAGTGIQLLTLPKDPARETWSMRTISEASQGGQLSLGPIGADPSPDLLLGTKWLSQGNGTWTLHTLSDAGGSPDRNRLADINGDGRLDAVVSFAAIGVPGKLVWYEQPIAAEGIWTEHAIATVVGPMSLDVADMDRDGDLDVVVGEHNDEKPTAARLWIFENVDGRGARWEGHLVYQGDDHYHGARVADVDHDGDLDILSIGWSHAKVLWYENQAAGGDAGRRRPATRR